MEQTVAGLTVTRSTPVIGAEIGGIDLREPLTGEVRDTLYRLLVEHQVLFWRDQRLDTAQQVAFAEAFGPILVLNSVIAPDQEYPGVHDVRGSTVGWHIDASAGVAPPVATVLRAVELPPHGGDTIWASGVAAYDGLPADLRDEIADLYCTHAGGRRDRDSDRPLVAHRLVRTHPDSGRRGLYLNLAPWEDAQVIGLGRRDSDALVERLRAEYLRPEYQVRFQWSPGAVAMWDNRVVQHTGTEDYGDATRLMKRICVASLH